MSRGAALSLFFVAAVAQFALLAAITFHRAGGWGNSGAAFALFIALACVPLGLVASVLLRSSAARLRPPVAVPFLAATLAGVLFPAAALFEYGHGSPFILLLGFVLQTLATIAAWRQLRHEA